jgi:hypothetical protein
LRKWGNPIDSGDGADHAIEVRGSLSNKSGAIALSGLHLAELVAAVGRGVGFADVGGGGGLHDGHSAGSGLSGDAQSDVGLLEAVQAAVIQHGCVASQQGVGDVTQDDLTVAQASSHAAVGVAVTASLDQAGVLADHAGHSIGNDAGGIGGDGVDGVQTLVAFGNVLTESGNVASTHSSGFGVGADDGTGECVEHLGARQLEGMLRDDWWKRQVMS